MRLVRHVKGQTQVVKLGRNTVTAQTAAMLRAIHRGQITAKDVKRIERLAAKEA